MVVIQVGREFEAVEALWTQFEGVMGKQPGKDGEEQEEEEEGNEEGDETMQG
jgi:DASH complex subunit DAD1